LCYYSDVDFGEVAALDVEQLSANQVDGSATGLPTGLLEGQIPKIWHFENSFGFANFEKKLALIWLNDKQSGCDDCEEKVWH
jgi:hypothetical protein